MKNSLINILYLTRAALLLCIFLCISADLLGATATINWNDKKNASVRSWNGDNVTFTFSGNNISHYSGITGTYLTIKGNTTYTVSWSVTPGYLINVTKIKGKFGNGSTSSYDLYFNTVKCKTVGGWRTEDNVYLQDLSEGNGGSITLSTTRDANVYNIEITYTITNVYTISLDNQSATTEGTASITATYGSSANLSGTPAITKPAKTGYAFGGYYTASNGGGSQIIDGNGNVVASVLGYTDGSKKWQHVGNVTLYAHWTAKTYSISLDNETPTVPGSTSVTLTYDSNSHAAITNPEKDGYTFDGWWTRDNGTGVKVIGVDGALQANVMDGTIYTGANGVWKKDATTTLYARWILNSNKTITLNNQSANTAGTTSVVVRYNTNGYSTNPIDAPAKIGYTFAGYYSATSGGVQVIDADGNVVASVTGYTDSDKKWINEAEETTLYARWIGVPYSVRFNGNGSTAGSMGNQAFVYGTAQNLTSNAFEKTCTVTYDANGGACGIASSETAFTFAGWATSEDGAVVYANGASVNNLTTTSGAVVDIYAKWSAMPGAVILPTPTIDSDWTFAGWYNAMEEFVGNAGASYTPTGDETLTAHWLPYTLTGNTDFDGIKGKYSFPWEGVHCTFTISSTGEMNYTSVGVAHMSIGEKCPTTISWTPTNADCDITVTGYRIVFGNPHVFSITLAVNGHDVSIWGANNVVEEHNLSIGTDGNILIYSYGGSANIESDYADIYSIELWYTITPKSPTPHNKELFTTVNLARKHTIPVAVNSGSNALFTMVDPASDFAYSYRLKEDYEHAFIEDGFFWADAPGDYEVQAIVNSDEDHEASEWSTATIHVTRVYVFNNNTTDKDWQTIGNWAYNEFPTANDSVLVIGDLTIDNEIEAFSFAIGDTAIVTIAPTGGLTVGEGGISGATPSNLILKAETSPLSLRRGQTGYVRISPEYTGAMPQATIELFTIGYYDRVREDAKWQYVGSPIVENARAKDVFANSYFYCWNETTGKWTNGKRTKTLAPFEGYSTTQVNNPSGVTISFEGTLVNGSSPVVLPLTYTESSVEPGCNVMANSFAAPIDISKFKASDFSDGVDATIYFFNTGSKSDLITQQLTKAINLDAAGQYIPVPRATAKYLHDFLNYPILIPSMQGFYVMTDEAGTLTLDYDRLVWQAEYEPLSIHPLRAPSHSAVEKEDDEISGLMQVTIYTEESADYAILLESPAYMMEYENGYDARKIMSGSMNVFTVEGEEQMSIDATDAIIGTRLGVRTGEETAYTFSFNNLRSENELALLDNETEQTIDIEEGVEYTFFAEPNTVIADRFMIVERDNADKPGVTTGIEQTAEASKVHKFIQSGKLFILKNGVLYDAMGNVVR